MVETFDIQYPFHHLSPKTRGVNEPISTSDTLSIRSRAVGRPCMVTFYVYVLHSYVKRCRSFIYLIYICKIFYLNLLFNHAILLCHHVLMYLEW